MSNILFQQYLENHPGLDSLGFNNLGHALMTDSSQISSSNLTIIVNFDGISRLAYQHLGNTLICCLHSAFFCDERNSRLFLDRLKCGLFKYNAQRRMDMGDIMWQYQDTISEQLT